MARNTHTTRILFPNLPLAGRNDGYLHALTVARLITPRFPLATQDENTVDGVAMRSCTIHHTGRQDDFDAIARIVNGFRDLARAFRVEDPQPIVATRRNPEPRCAFTSAYRIEEPSPC